MNTQTRSGIVEQVPDRTRDAVLIQRSDSIKTVRGEGNLEKKEHEINTRDGSLDDEGTSGINSIDSTLSVTTKNKFRGILLHEKLEVTRKLAEDDVEPLVTDVSAEAGEGNTLALEAPVTETEKNESDPKPRFSIRNYLAQYSQVDIEKAELIGIFTGLALVMIMISCCISCMRRKNDDEDSDEELVVNFKQKFTKIQFTDSPGVFYGDETEQSSSEYTW